MFRTNPAPDRVQLGFAEAVLSAFDFLTREYDFHLVRAEPTFVRYESPNVFVNIYHGRASYELGVEIGQLISALSQEDQPFSIGEIIDLMGAREETGYTFLQASTAARVSEYVPKLADFVKKSAAPALEGDTDIFRQLAEKRSEKSDELLKEWHLSDVREKADIAWQEKNYAKLADLYESIREELTPAEAKKLDYAKKHS
jgi:hypothetical protein